MLAANFVLAAIFMPAAIFVPAANLLLAAIFVPAAFFGLAGLIVFCLFCCCTSQVYSYGHEEDVSSPSHTFHGEA